MTTGAAAARGDDHSSSSRGSASVVGHGAAGVDYQRAFRRLCHIAPLTEGKADEALDAVIVTALVLTEEPVRGIDGVLEAVDAFFAVPLEKRLVEDAVDRLFAGGVLLRSKGRIRPSAETTADTRERIDVGRDLEERVRKGWLSSSGAVASGVDDTVLWRCLSSYMASVFRTHGMLAVELLDPTIESSTTDLTAADEALREALLMVPEHAATATRQAIQGFFDAPSAERSRYIAQMLDATFTLFAMTLDETAAGYLRADLQPLDLFLDTNVVFGLLELDTSERGQAAKEVIRFLRGNDFPVTLYYHERTLAEIERTISGIGSNLRTRNWPQKLSRAAVDRRVLGELRGVERRYHELNAETPITPKDFLSKYDHVQELLESWGVRLFRTPGIPQYTTERKAILIAEYDAFVKALRPQEPKSYEAKDHDISVWLDVTCRGRPAPTSLGVGALFVTNDLLFRRFTSITDSRRAPRAVIPAQLLQVLRPFGRPDLEDDRRFVATLCLPEFRTAHSGYADTQRKVMGFLAHYQDVDTETAVRILANEVLLRRVRDLDIESTEFETVIESAVLRDNAELAQQKDAAAAELQRVRAESARVLQEKGKELAVRGQRSDDLEEQLAAAIRAASEAQEKARLVTDAAEVQRNNLDAKSRRDARRLAAGVFIILTLATAVSTARAALSTSGVGGLIVGGLGLFTTVILTWFGLSKPRLRLADWFQPQLFRRYLGRIGQVP